MEDGKGPSGLFLIDDDSERVKEAGAKLFPVDISVLFISPRLKLASLTLLTPLSVPSQGTLIFGHLHKLNPSVET